MGTVAAERPGVAGRRSSRHLERAVESDGRRARAIAGSTLAIAVANAIQVRATPLPSGTTEAVTAMTAVSAKVRLALEVIIRRGGRLKLQRSADWSSTVLL